MPRSLAFILGLLDHHAPARVSVEEFPGPSVALLEILQQEGEALRVASLDSFLRGNGAVRFHASGGSLWAGVTLLGEVPVGSREYHFLACLAERLDQVVPYADL